jgi:DNA-binding CsgD family transcriptional regulator
VHRVDEDGIAGRDSELSAAQSALHDGRSVLLSGQPGIGKSAVLEAIVGRLAKTDSRVLRCSPAQAEAGLPFVTLIDLLSAVPAAGFDSVSPVPRRAVEAALLRAEISEAQPDPLAVRLGVQQVLQGLTVRGSLVVVIDDVQWVDPPSAEALGFAARRLSGPGFRIVAAGRGEPDEVARFLPLLPAGASQIAVGPLALETLVPLLVRRSGPGLTRVAAAEIHRATQGNPLFALEIADALARRRAVRAPGGGGPLPVPGELRELMLERLAALAEPVRSTLVVASAMARPTATLLREAGHPGAEADLASAEQAGVARLLTDGSVVFGHPLMRTVVYGEARTAERMAMHATLAALIDEPVDHARHLALASAVEDEAVARTLSAAAETARRRGAAGMAAELSQLSADRTPHADTAAKAERLLAAAWHSYAARLNDQSRQIASSVLAMDVPRATRARAAFVLLELAGQAIGQAGDLADAAIADAAGDPALEAVAAYHSAWRYFALGKYELGLAEGHRAVAAAEAGDDLPTLVRSLQVLIITQEVSGDDGHRTTLARALELLDSRQTVDASSLRIHRIHARHLAGERRFAEARAAGREVLRLAEQGGWIDEICSAVSTALKVELDAGEYPAALHLARRLTEVTEEDDEANLGSRLGSLARAELLAGSAEQARDLAARGLECALRSSDLPSAIVNSHRLGSALLLLGEPAGAVAALSRARDLTLSSALAGRLWAPDLAEALLLAGDAAGARATIDEARSVAETAANLEMPAELDRVEAQLAAAEGRLDEAAEQLARVVAQQRGRTPVDLVRALIALAGVERRRRRRGAARTVLTEAREICVRSGAAPWLTLVDAELARLQAGRQPGEDKSLTAVEERVVAMAVEGATNREIAAAISISVKTVEGTLSRAYRKLGVRSRVELVRARDRRDVTGV